MHFATALQAKGTMQYQQALQHALCTLLTVGAEPGNKLGCLQCSKDCLARLQLLSKVSLEAVAEMHKKESQHAVCSEHEVQTFVCSQPYTGHDVEPLMTCPSTACIECLKQLRSTVQWLQLCVQELACMLL